jgi:hypothetical protein
LWLEILSHFSLAITTFFLLEIPLSIWAFGFRYYNPFGDNPHASLHIFDAVIIIMTFVLEFVLKGKEKEVAGLLVVLRLWRLVKLVGGMCFCQCVVLDVSDSFCKIGIAIGAGHIGEEEAKQLAEAQEELERLRQELISTKEENSRLQSQLDALRG